MDRAYAVFHVKNWDDEERVIEGIATTPTPDRVGDVVEPMGAKYALPMALLWQHNHEQPVGNVEFAKPTAKGIPFRARVAKISEPGALRDLTDMAWQAVKANLVRAVSIGFRSIEHELMKDGGIRFKQWEWLELSLVTVPANAEATIATIKSIDRELRAASGNVEPSATTRRTPPGVSGPVYLTHKHTPGGAMLETKIKDFESTRHAKFARMEAITEEAAKAGRTKDEAEQEEFDTLKDEIKRIDQELKDLRDMQVMRDSATPVHTETTTKAASESRGPRVTVKTTPRLDPGVRFARAVKAIGWAHRKHRDVEMVAREMYPDDHLVHKAAVAAGTTSNDTWAGPLVGDEGTAFADFVEYLRPQTIIGRFGQGGVPALRNVPFRTPLIAQTSGGRGYWVGEGKPKPLTKFDFSRTTVEPLKVANIAVLTDEVLRDSSPAADAIVRDAMRDALVERLDQSFIDPSFTGTPTVSPDSITNGAPVVVAETWQDADDVRLDVRSLFQLFIDADNPPTQGVWVMSHTNALALSLLVNGLGQPEFPGMGLMGGTFMGLPVIASQYVGDYVVLVNASDIYVADEGGIAVDVSREASLEMQDDDTVAQDQPTGASLVSLWQNNMVGFRAERTINWLRRRESAVAVLSGVEWGGPVNEPAS